MVREVEQLRDRFLPTPFDPIGNYADLATVQANARAFLVFSHAEVESYLEEWAKEIASKARTTWGTNQRLSYPLLTLLAVHGETYVPPEALRAGEDATQKLSALVEEAFTQFFKVIKDNNGVKEKNLLALFMPLGLPASAVAATLFPLLKDFGAARGKHAHHSVRAVETPLDPVTEYDRVQAVLNALRDLDAWLVGCKRRIR